MRSLREMYAKTADTLGRIETARSQSPIEAVMKMPMAKAGAGWAAAKARVAEAEALVKRAQVERDVASAASAVQPTDSAPEHA